MNDLNGLDLNAKPVRSQPGNYTAFTSLKPTPPVSGRTTPLISKDSTSTSVKPSTPANDSFANLVAFSSSKSNTNLSLSDQQKKLADQRAHQLYQQRTTLGSQSPVNDDLWNTLGSGKTTPANGNTKSDVGPVVKQEEDLFAAFNNDLSAVTRNNGPPPSARGLIVENDEDDDDPFELSKLSNSEHGRVQTMVKSDDDEFDILGDLARPATSKPVHDRPAQHPTPIQTNQPRDKAVAELVDMGFPAEKARQALETTSSGHDVQAAVSWLLNEAHAEAQAKSQSRRPQASPSEPSAVRSRQPRQAEYESDGSLPPSDRVAASASEAAKKAQEYGGIFMKQAGSFWKQAQKQVQQAVSDFNSDSESSQPKWMAGPTTVPRSEASRQRGGSFERRNGAMTTDEAAMLEQERPAQPPRPSRTLRQDVMFDSSADSSRDHSPAMPSRLRQGHSPQQAMPTRSVPSQSAARSVLSKQAVEDQAAQAYTSSARRRRPPQATETTADLLPDTPIFSQKPNTLQTRPTPPTSVPVRQPPPPVRPKAPPPSRNLPQINALSLKSSHVARIGGNDAFKLGDYTAAHTHYTTSLRHIPSQHTITLPLLTNRALTSLKLGDPKSALQDSDTALTLIGPSKGDGEVVDLQTGAAADVKPMRDYYGKAIQRKAEALEQLEKWADAVAIWKQCVEDGIGGQSAVQARVRAEKAAAPKPAQPTRPSVPRKPAVQSRPNTLAQKPAAAVKALREANAAATKEDDEKFALSDNVTGRINSWKNGKEGNLRALLASLDTVLWPEAGWKKVGMAELVLVNKVKINYMKGIGKTHPDKIPTNATVEQRMIAGSVFSTLNEAWDKFKTENGL